VRTPACMTSRIVRLSKAVVVSVACVAITKTVCAPGPPGPRANHIRASGFCGFSSGCAHLAFGRMPIAHPRTMPSPREGIATPRISAGVMQFASEAQTNKPKRDPRARLPISGTSTRVQDTSTGRGKRCSVAVRPRFYPRRARLSTGSNVWPAFSVTFAVTSIADASGACSRTVVRKHSAQAEPSNGASTALDRSSIKGKAI
jgi:hypothetical protein